MPRRRTPFGVMKFTRARVSGAVSPRSALHQRGRCGRSISHRFIELAGEITQNAEYWVAAWSMLNDHGARAGSKGVGCGCGL